MVTRLKILLGGGVAGKRGNWGGMGKRVVWLGLLVGIVYIVLAHGGGGVGCTFSYMLLES